MKESINRWGGRAMCLWGLTIAIVASFHVLSSSAQIITLIDQNSTANIDVTPSAGNSGGMTNWIIDGQNELAQQWFWYRVGSSGPERPISAIGPLSFSTINARTLYTTYNNGAYGVTINYLLTGSAPGSGKSDVSESISITNATASTLEFHFFQYSDFDLGGPGGDSVTLGKNLRGLFNEARQTDASSTVFLTETVVTPGANQGEAAFYPVTLTKLSDGSTDNLGTTSTTAGVGDVTWAFQWDLNIAPFSSVGISKDKYLQIPTVPEPSALAFISGGLLALIIQRRARKVR